MVGESAQRRYARLTSYVVGRPWLVPAPDPSVRRDFLPMVEESKPQACKRYPDGLPTTALPRTWRADTSAGASLLGGAGDGPARPADLDELSRLLYHSAGVVRERRRRSGEMVRFRAAGSAGNLQPIELYVQAAGVDGLPDGVWHYGAAGHELTRVGPPIASGLAIILTGVPWRSEWKYAERGYRYVWWDAGSVVAQLELLAGSAGWRSTVRLSFPDAEIAAAVGADEVAEVPLAVIEFGDGVTWTTPAEPAVGGDLGPAGPTFPLVREMHEAGRQRSWSSPRAVEPTGRQAAVPVVGSQTMTVDEVLGRRAACRAFAPEPVGSEDLAWPVAVAMRSVDWDGGDPEVTAFAVVHAVEGLAVACYNAGRGLIKVGPDVSAAEQRAASAAMCLSQKAAGTCAYLVLFAADADARERAHGDRGYRELQLLAGLMVGRLQLAAGALDLGSIPLTIHDELAGRLAGDGLAPLIAIAVGRRLHAVAH